MNASFSGLGQSGFGAGAQGLSTAPSPGLPETGTGLISKGRGCLFGHLWKKQSPILLPGWLAGSPPPLSLPLSTDRSFDSGSKFAPQTCWEAALRCRRKAFLHFKDPERLPERLSETPRLIIKCFFAQLWL